MTRFGGTEFKSQLPHSIFFSQEQRKHFSLRFELRYVHGYRQDAYNGCIALLLGSR